MPCAKPVTTSDALIHGAEFRWEGWSPRDRAVLCFIRDRGRILLILKKRGLGAGKFNAPGGRIEPGETPEAAAIRETREEVRVEVSRLRGAGELRFQFVDGYSLHCYLFVAGAWAGTPTETDEAAPAWFTEDALPYDRMWEDDRHWLPLLMSNQAVDGRFVFDGDKMLSMSLSQAEVTPVI